jgi:hypothetical protein
VYHGGVFRLAMALACLMVPAGCRDREVITFSLDPIDPTGVGCGQLAGAGSVVVAALGESGEVRASLSPEQGAVTLESFPHDIHQLAVEVRAGNRISVGKTIPFDLDVDWPEQLAIAMAPLDGFCPMENLVKPRRHPLVVAAGAGALVLGGDNPEATEDGEWFDLSTGHFVSVANPPLITSGWNGAAACALADGRIVVVGGPHPAYAVFDPETRQFLAPALFEQRSFHVAVALDDHRVLVAGGCAEVAAGACAPGSASLSSVVIDIDSGGIIAGPVLQQERIFATAWLESGSPSTVVIAGGPTLAGAAVDGAERIDLLAMATGVIAGNGGVAATLDSGSTLVGFSPRAQPPSGQVGAVVPGHVDMSPVVASLPRGGASMVTLEDGSAAVFFGGGPTSGARYDLLSGWVPFSAGGPSSRLQGYGMARLIDGSVLIAGGEDEDGVRADAWLFRPPLLGPWSASVTVTPRSASSTGMSPVPLSVFDPAGAERDGEDLALMSSDDRGNWVTVSGPRFVSGQLRAAVKVASGGLVLLARFRGAGDHVAVRLVPGQPARVVRRVGGLEEPLCTADAALPLWASDAVLAVHAVVDDDHLQVTVAAEPVIACAIGRGEAGAFGVGALGTAGRVIVETLTVER